MCNDTSHVLATILDTPSITIEVWKNGHICVDTSGAGSLVWLKHSDIKAMMSAYQSAMDKQAHTAEAGK